MKLINSCSTKYNKGGAPQQKNPGVQQTRRGTQHTHRRTSHTNIQPNQNHTNTYVRIYTHIYPKEYARIRQSSANEITEIHKTHTGKERLEISLFRLDNGVSLGHACCSFFFTWASLDVTAAMVSIALVWSAAFPHETSITGSIIHSHTKARHRSQRKRAHREFNIVTHLSHSPLSFNQRFIIFTSLQEGLRSEDKLPDASRPQASPSGHGML